MKRIKLVAESHVPYIDALGAVADIRRLGPAEFTPESIAGADALIVRTRTRCDAALLEGSDVRFVGTATIGTDHIDLDLCRRLGITVANAPACNAPAVAQYVFASLAALANRPLAGYTIGIVGVGHVGSIVERWARSLGMKVMRCDPPRQRTEGGDDWFTLDDIARRADIITFHTPLTREGKDATYHLGSREFFASLRRAPIIINAARGPVVDNEAWADALEAGVTGPAVIDCWEGEPSISRRLLGLASIATPHIAGYSAPGKMRATQMVADAMTDCFGLPHVDCAPCPVPDVPDAISQADAAFGYDPMADDRALRANPEAFESLRNNYALRPELIPGKSF